VDSYLPLFFNLVNQLLMTLITIVIIIWVILALLMIVIVANHVLFNITPKGGQRLLFMVGFGKRAFMLKFINKGGRSGGFYGYMGDVVLHDKKKDEPKDELENISL
jgi:hypothetical protein